MAPELRVIGPEGENFGVLAKAEALVKAQEASLDLIEISPTAQPPVAKIMDLGKYLYQQQKKQKDAAKKAHETGVKGVQIGLGTSLHDLEMRAKKIEEFLKEGHRVRVEMGLRGREKYMDKNFLNERLNRVLHLVSEKYKVAEAPKKSPRGMAMIIENPQVSNSDARSESRLKRRDKFMKGFKTNKSFTKRIKITRKGKILGRKSGLDHFNAKQPRRKQLRQKNLDLSKWTRKISADLCLIIIK